MDKQDLIGYYKDRATIKDKDAQWEPLYPSNLQEVSDTSEPNPYKKETNSYLYQCHKRNYLRQLVFSNGYAMLDIDGGNLCKSNHPAVFAYQFTGNGTHILIHSKSLESRNKNFDNAYDAIALEIWKDLGDLARENIIDHNNSNPKFRAYLWPNKWVLNPNYDPNYKAKRTFITKSEHERIYAGGASGGLEKEDAQKEAKEKRVYATKITKPMLASANLGITDFLSRWEEKYDPITNSRYDTEKFTTYNGVTVDVYVNDGTLLKTNKYGKSTVSSGTRANRLFAYACQCCHLLAKDGKIDTNKIVVEAARYMKYRFDTYKDFTTKELIKTVIAATQTYHKYTGAKIYDKRKAVVGLRVYENGKSRKLYVGERIQINAYVRKSLRILEVLKHWNPKNTVSQNLLELENKGVEGKKATVLEYLRLASQWDYAINLYPWVKDYKPKREGGKKRKRSGKRIRLTFRAKNMEFEFGSQGEVIKWFGKRGHDIGIKTLNKWLKGGCCRLSRIYDLEYI